MAADPEDAEAPEDAEIAEGVDDAEDAGEDAEDECEREKEEAGEPDVLALAVEPFYLLVDNVGNCIH